MGTSDTPDDDAADRAEVIAGLVAIAAGSDCECRTCTTLRRMDRLLAGDDLPD